MARNKVPKRLTSIRSFILRKIRSNGWIDWPIDEKQICLLREWASTVARLTPIRDENNNTEVATAMAPLDQLTHAGIAVGAIHHAGWGPERSRGASAFQRLRGFRFDLR
jgi:hypothetical protein